MESAWHRGQGAYRRYNERLWGSDPFGERRGKSQRFEILSIELGRFIR